MKTLLILNDPPYGTERSYNALRLAKALTVQRAAVTVFLLADAVVCAKTGQKVPQGFYSLELMVKSVARKGEVLLCGTCMDARGLTDEELVEGVKRSTMDELASRRLQRSVCWFSEQRVRIHSVSSANMVRTARGRARADD